ncbi:P-loop NTPase fold protein [Pelagibacteraceae bacterium]|nr:P-loop NTPase fold protein [Pelagibacteraceae bacterium]
MVKITHLIKNKNSQRIKKYYLNFLKKQEISGEPFYDKLGQLNLFYLPISEYIYKSYKNTSKPFVVGLSGGQGSGKTTITKIIKLILEKKYNFNVVNFSIDDFYKTRAQRNRMAKQIHELFITRGVPGSHDVKLLKKCFYSLNKKKFKKFHIPMFNKSLDERMQKNKWQKITKKPNIVLFEGWCVGSKPQNLKQLKRPINYLEKKYDIKLTWRKKVNNELKNNYSKIFRLIDKLIFLKVPHFKYVYKWRLLQEKKLKIKSKGKKIMNKNEIKKFIMFYERITKEMMKSKKNYDVVIKLDKKHRLTSIKFN